MVGRSAATNATVSCRHHRQSEGIMNRRNLGILSLTSLLLLLAATTLSAQQVYGVKTTIPFEFKVYDQTCPAGDYVVTFPVGPINEVMLLRKASGEGVALIGARPRTPSQRVAHPYLLFRGYGTQHFLAEVSTGVNGSARAVAMSKTEKEIVSGRTAQIEQYKTILIAGR